MMHVSGADGVSAYADLLVPVRGLDPQPGT